jgi:hypothetical protein
MDVLVQLLPFVLTSIIGFIPSWKLCRKLEMSPAWAFYALLPWAGLIVILYRAAYGRVAGYIILALVALNVVVAIVVAIMPARAQPLDERFSLACAGFKTAPPENDDHDPVVVTEVILVTHGRGKDRELLSMDVQHLTLAKETYSRAKQYRDIRLWTDQDNLYWSGVSIKNPSRKMVGQLNANTARKEWSYIERSFIDGRLERTTTSACAAQYLGHQD